MNYVQEKLLDWGSCLSNNIFQPQAGVDGSRISEMGKMAPNSRGANLLFGQFFSKNYMKMKKNWIGRGDSKILLCISATDNKKAAFLRQLNFSCSHLLHLLERCKRFLFVGLVTYPG